MDSIGDIIRGILAKALGFKVEGFPPKAEDFGVEGGDTPGNKVRVVEFDRSGIPEVKAVHSVRIIGVEPSKKDVDGKLNG